MAKSDQGKIDLLGVRVDSCSVEELNTYIFESIQNSQKKIVANVNVHAFNLAWTLPWLREFFNTADLVFCDGFGVKLAAKILGRPLSARITYADWMWQLSRYFEPRNCTFFFLGSREGIVQKAAEEILKVVPNLKIAGTHHGYFEKSPDSAQNLAVIQLINSIKPDILIVGFGMPLQEKWLAENWEKIDAHVALTGGAVFDYISGDLQRAPHWMTDHGLEWLGRLLIEPHRLWRRYILGNPLFFYRVLKQRLGLLHFE